mgnify:FL=1
MAFGKRNSSSSVAKERLKLVLIHDRAGTSPSSNILQMLRKDIFAVISKYFDVVESDFDLEIKNTSDIANRGCTRLTADVPSRSIKSLGRNRY